MRRRFSFVTTIIIMLAIVFILVLGTHALLYLAGMQLPNWLDTPLSIISMYIALEIAARIGPKAFNTRLDEMVGEHNHYRNKIAMMLFILVPIILIEFQRVHDMNSFWRGLFLLVIGMLLGYLVALAVGTPGFRKALLPKPLRGQH